ncbi:hypothetical protein OH76DRAFT_1395311 [Lentinus brumalis]|uniref:Uncharacterized protein n=1 Tax=Lentinus brumalis TaxID=2498619 RepID=A0A371DYA4_9APHY|nr:hypothetical protein OH76DRAFT_1395311 [Polyporus brumalis]
MGYRQLSANILSVLTGDLIPWSEMVTLDHCVCSREYPISIAYMTGIWTGKGRPSTMCTCKYVRAFLKLSRYRPSTAA